MKKILFLFLFVCSISFSYAGIVIDTNEKYLEVGEPLDITISMTDKEGLIDTSFNGTIFVTISTPEPADTTDYAQSDIEFGFSNITNKVFELHKFTAKDKGIISFMNIFVPQERGLYKVEASVGIASTAGGDDIDAIDNTQEIFEQIEIYVGDDTQNYYEITLVHPRDGIHIQNDSVYIQGNTVLGYQQGRVILNGKIAEHDFQARGDGRIGHMITTDQLEQENTLLLELLSDEGVVVGRSEQITFTYEAPAPQKMTIEEQFYRARSLALKMSSLPYTTQQKIGKKIESYMVDNTISEVAHTILQFLLHLTDKNKPYITDCMDMVKATKKFNDNVSRCEGGWINIAGYLKTEKMYGLECWGYAMNDEECPEEAKKTAVLFIPDQEQYQEKIGREQLLLGCVDENDNRYAHYENEQQQYSDMFFPLYQQYISSEEEKKIITLQAQNVGVYTDGRGGSDCETVWRNITIQNK